MIKAIIFDCFGVLTADSWRVFVDSLPSATTAQKARELNHQYDAGLLTTKEFLDQVHEITGKEPQLVETLLDHEVVKNDILFDYIRELKKTYKIGLLSNIATDWIRDSFLSPQEQELFDDMIFSHTVGITKPNPRIFQLACKGLGVELGEAIMVDDIESYVLAAQAAGMKGVVYRDFMQFKSELEPLLRHT